jgi:inner membrane protease ATP23
MIKTAGPAVVFMSKHLGLNGATLSPENIQCVPCDAMKAGGFSPEDRAVVLCQGRFFSRSHMEDTLMHELVHMYDHAKFKVNWSDLRHHACSEVRDIVDITRPLLRCVFQIRANSLSGDCKFTRELRRGTFSFSKQHQASSLN